MQTDLLKLAKETHVTGHNGTTLLENFQISIIPPVCYLIWKSCDIQIENQMANYIYDFLMLVIPIVIGLTKIEWVESYMLCLVAFMFSVMLFAPTHQTNLKTSKVTSIEPAMVVQRAMLQLQTVIAILAVDFHVMPRRFIKCETQGLSPVITAYQMDIGVAGFVFGSGLVAGPRLLNSLPTAAKFRKTFKLMIPTFILGFGRAFCTKLLNYAEHVTEYGVHWNFFITLTLLPLLTTIHVALFSKIPLLLAAVFVLAGFEVWLASGLQEYIFHAPRTNLISMNREGIFSLVGSD